MAVGAGITFSPDLTRVTRLASEIRASMQGPVRVALAAAHEDMAERVRDYAADELKKTKSHRPGRGNLMEQAIKNRQNSVVSANGFTVGEPDWLDVSPAALYYRRIEEGGPNPMAAFGLVGGQFFVPGGPHAPDNEMRGGLGVHGRLFWGHPRKGGFQVEAQDVASRGYHVHERAGRWFLNGRMPLTSYKRAFDSVGIDFVRLYEGYAGAQPTNVGILAGRGRTDAQQTA